MIRRYTWHDYYVCHSRLFAWPSNATARGSDVGLHMHVDHCIETLRLVLACESDTAPLFVVRDAEAMRGSGPISTCSKIVATLGGCSDG
jgi:hypothetical protein